VGGDDGDERPDSDQGLNSWRELGLPISIGTARMTRYGFMWLCLVNITIYGDSSNAMRPGTARVIGKLEGEQWTKELTMEGNRDGMEHRMGGADAADCR
jgi:hypothetical protein